jgi:cytoskeletal protein CcmA (bactofilin family)
MEGVVVSTQAVARNKERSAGINTPRDNWLGFVGDVVKFTGEVTFKWSLRIDGSFCGQINSQDGTLVVSTGAKISAAVINVAVAKINGTVEGEVHANELVLGRTANLTGDVSVRSLSMEEGAVFNGRCHHL